MDFGYAMFILSLNTFRIFLSKFKNYMNLSKYQNVTKYMTNTITIIPPLHIINVTITAFDYRYAALSLRTSVLFMEIVTWQHVQYSTPWIWLVYGTSQYLLRFTLRMSLQFFIGAPSGLPPDISFYNWVFVTLVTVERIM